MVFGTQAALRGRSDRRFGPIEFVWPGRARSVERKVVGVEVGRQFEQVVGRLSGVERMVEKEPVVGRSMVRTELGWSIGMVRLIESQFVGEPVVGQLVVFDPWTELGWWPGSVGRKMKWVTRISSVRCYLFDSRVGSRL